MLAGGWIQDFLAPVTGFSEVDPPIPGLAITLLAVLVVAAGVTVAILFVGRRDVPREAPQDVSFPTRAARAELYGNEINDELAVKPGGALVSGLTYLDTYGVDGFVEGTARAVGGVGLVLRRAQTGFVRSYALSLLAGAVLVVVALLAVNAA
jgi:NADH-quinone oxidoreductase subunit L